MGRKKNTDERREQIVNALYDCLAENGHESVTVKQIAERAGLTHGAIHYFFAGKDEIIEALVISLIDRYEQDFNRLLESSPTGKEIAPRILDHFLDIFIFDKQLFRVFINLIQMSFERENVRVQMKKLFDAYRKNMRKFNLLAGIEEKNAALLALGITALIDGLGVQRAIDVDSVNKKSVSRLFVLLGQAIGLPLNNDG